MLENLGGCRLLFEGGNYGTMLFFLLSGYKSIHRNLSLYLEQQRNGITYLVSVAQDNIQL